MSKKNYVSKNFWSIKGHPTQNAVLAYTFIIKHLNGKKITNVSDSLIKKAQEFVGVPPEKDSSVMLKWGLNPGNSRSTTSRERYEAMLLGYKIALGMTSMGVELSTVTP